MEKVNLAEKFSLFTEQYQPKIVGEVNDLHVKLVKLRGDFVWHHHDLEDELFFVVKGALKIGFVGHGHLGKPSRRKRSHNPCWKSARCV